MSKNILQIDNKIPLLGLITLTGLCIVYIVSTNNRVDNLDRATADKILALKENQDLKIRGLELQQQVQQNTLDLRGQWSVGKNDKLNKVETDLAVSISRIDKLESSIFSIETNIQKIADGIAHAKVSR